MAQEARDEPLGERAQHLLRVLIESYIRDGQPVGSRALSRDSGLQLSSATIRNVMADLEELGFVTSPHTSAGRVPTDKGYRFFVDTLLQRAPARRGGQLRRSAASSRPARDDSTALVATASQLLSQRHASGGRGDAAAHPRRPRITPDRVRGAVREPRAGGAGVQRPRGAEPHHPARAALLAPRSCSAPRTSSTSSSAAAR